jgi:hypothetical protein
MTTTMMWKAWGSFAVGAALLAGCGGGGSSTPISESDFCAQKADKECQVPTAKCGNVTKAACVAQRQALCLTVVAASKTAPRVFKPGNVPACVAKASATYAKTTITPADLADLDNVCAYVFQGNSTTACTVKYDCAGGVDSKICDKGQCSVKTVKNKTAGCANPGEVCNPADSYCANAPGAASPTCLPKAAQSEPCSASIPCVPAMRCDGVTGTCVPRAMATESCTVSDDCATAAPFCDPYIGNKCDLGLSFAPGADACSAFGGASSGTGGSGGGGTGGATGENDASSNG